MANQSSQPSLFAQLAGVVCQFKLGDRVYKKSGSAWHGFVVGFYSTKLTPVGVAVESEREPGSVQIYPVAALCLAVPQPSNALQSSLDLEPQTTSEQSVDKAEQHDLTLKRFNAVNDLIMRNFVNAPIEDVTNPDYSLKDDKSRENPQPKPVTSDEKVNPPDPLHFGTTAYLPKLTTVQPPARSAVLAPKAYHLVTPNIPKTFWAWKDILSSFKTRLDAPKMEHLKNLLKPHCGEQVRLRLTVDNAAAIRVQKFTAHALHAQRVANLNTPSLFYCDYSAMVLDWMTNQVLWLNGHDNSAYIEFRPDFVETNMLDTPDFAPMHICLTAPSLDYVLT